jgi:phosphatidylethanolamine/phosphatidyl-N-methylethanolamine N-methyltransferase
VTATDRKHWPKFVSEFLLKPGSTGSLVPSSSHLARMMVQYAGLADAEAVLEYGPGTGAFTKYILQELGPHTKFAAIEINSQFAAIFRDAHPNVTVVEDSVENVRAICDSLQIDSVDCVVSGLPWAFFSESMQVRFLDQMMRVLKPGGRFVTFGYLQGLALPAARRLAALLPTYFTSVSKSPVVWRNFPPAFVYRCRR